MIEPNLDRVWAALMTGAQPGRAPFTRSSARHLRPRRCAEGSQRHPSGRRRGTGHRLVLHRHTLAKIEEIRQQPRVSLLGYDADAGRLEGNATIDIDGPEKATAWASCRSERHFAVIVVSVIRIGWLDISGPLHRHAVFQRAGRDWRGRWVSPWVTRLAVESRTLVPRPSLRSRRNLSVALSTASWLRPTIRL